MTEFETQVLRYLKSIREETHAMLALLSQEYVGEDPSERCPECGSAKIEDTSTTEGKRITCLDCTKSTWPNGRAPEVNANG